jgi:hypothetical protein
MLQEPAGPFSSDKPFPRQTKHDSDSKFFRGGTSASSALDFDGLLRFDGGARVEERVVASDGLNAQFGRGVRGEVHSVRIVAVVEK